MGQDSYQDLVVPGSHVTGRGDDWIITNVTRHTDCRAVRLSGCGRGNVGVVRTLLIPFDKLIPSVASGRINVLSRRRWLRQVSRLVRGAEPFGSLATAASADIQLLPFQLEPALAMLRHGRSRLLIADEVGLGKTIQTAVILRQLSSDVDSFRALILTPAGVREQWQQELQGRFALPATVADAAWLAATARDLPPDINPWSLPGVYIASLDLVKRPEVLRALEDVSWDLTVVDEVHGAGLGTARLAAADAVARTARRVVLLTATPPDAEPAHVAALANLGRLRSSGPVTQFRRGRADAGVAAGRKTVLLPVRLSRTERRLHRLLDRYTRLVWNEADSRGDVRARLAAVILRKRALSSAGSLALSVRRRLLLLGTSTASREQQLLLPLHDEDPLDDELQDSVIGASGLSDVALERAWLEQIAAAADRASGAESKLSLLGRLLRRTAEPVIIFTEYRDTLAQLAAMITRLRPVLMLHGGMTPRERAGVQRAFNTSGSVLLATDAASEGLNLHGHCRLVVHFELPWTPARLEQRTGRVDRLGQTRRVHEVLLVARHTCERLVLAPLLRRARTAAARGGPAARMAALAESDVARAVMDGLSVKDDAAAGVPDLVSINIRGEAEAVAIDLGAVRRLARAEPTAMAGRTRTGVAVTRARKGSGRVVLMAVEVGLERSDGRPVHRELVPLRIDSPALGVPRRAATLARLADAFIARHSPRACATAEASCRARLDEIAARYVATVRAAAERQKDIAGAAPSTARRLVQVGLFDAREARAAAARRKSASLALVETGDRLSDLALARTLRTTARVVAVRFGWEPRP